LLKFFLEYFPLIALFTCSKLDTNQFFFCMFKAFKPRKWTIFVFFKRLFFLPNMLHSFWKLERILTLMIRRAKGLELMKIVFITLEHIWFKSLFDLENYGFWKCDFNKNCSYICNKGHEFITYMISNQFVVKMYLYVKCNVKCSIKNTKL